MKQTKFFSPLIFVILLLSIPFFTCGAEQKNSPVFPLTVRIMNGKKPVRGLTVDDFSLNINNRPLEIVKAAECDTSLSDRPEFLGRNIVLSFRTIEYNEKLEDAITYLVTDVLVESDVCFLATPVKAYRLNVSPDKKNMVFQISRLLAKDCSEYKKLLNRDKKSLENQARTLISFLRSDAGDDRMMIRSYKRIGTFLNTFPQGFLNFRENYLYPNPDRQGKILEELGNREGERWWIHFEQGNIYETVSIVKDAIRMIEEYFTGNTLARQTFGKPLETLKKMITLGDSFPEESIKRLFIDNDIRYNALVWNRRMHKNSSKTAETTSQLVSILDRIAICSGGTALQTSLPATGAMEMARRRDHFYLLEYGEVNPGKNASFSLDLNVKTDGKAETKPDLFYPPQIKIPRRENDLESGKEKKISITGVSYEKTRHKGKKAIKLSFSLESFQLNGTTADSKTDQDSPFGLVKVRIDCLDFNGNRTFRTGNTLRTSKRTVSVSIPIPAPQTGKSFRLVIIACDLIANRLAKIERTVSIR